MKFKILLVFVFFSINLFAQKSEEEKTLEYVKKTINDYKKYCSFTKNFDSLSPEYLKHFKKLVSPSAQLFNDILLDSLASGNLKINDYIKEVKEHYKTGFEVNDVTIDFFVVEKNRDRETKEKYPKIADVRVLKSFNGYYDEKSYIDKKIYLNIFIGISRNYENNKILNIEENIKNKIKRDTISTKINNDSITKAKKINIDSINLLKKEIIEIDSVIKVNEQNKKETEKKIELLEKKKFKKVEINIKNYAKTEEKEKKDREKYKEKYLNITKSNKKENKKDKKPKKAKNKK